MLDLTYLLSILATVTFSVTGVLAARAYRIDLFGILVVGVVTAVGGGTIRDIILDVPVFWIKDGGYIWAAVMAAMVTFALRNTAHKAYQALLYLDAFGVALFATLAVEKTLSLGFGNLHATVMGVITGIGGGLIRDLLTGRPTLIMSRDLYATPILLGIGVQLAVLEYTHLGKLNAFILGGTLIFLFRAAAIRYHWQMPAMLTHDGRDQS
jgi:uncharacterized membrane protein YeiH